MMSCRTERRLLVEQGGAHVAAIDVVLPDGAQLLVTTLFLEQLRQGQRGVAVIAEEPHVGLARLFQHALKRQRQRTAVLVIGKGIVAGSIL